MSLTSSLCKVKQNIQVYVSLFVLMLLRNNYTVCVCVFLVFLVFLAFLRPILCAGVSCVSRVSCVSWVS